MIRNAATALICVLFLLLSAVLAHAEKRVALIIGNSNYQHVPVLLNPARDARAMAAKFQEAGYDVVSAQYDLGNLEFKRALRRFEDAAADADIAVVYYAGHGIEIHDINYLIPVDAKLVSDRDAPDEAVKVERILEILEGARRLRVVILDACRDNPFASKMQQQQRTAVRGIVSGLRAVEPTDSNTLIAFAAKEGASAEDGDSHHSPFTAALLDNLFLPGLDIRLAFGRVRDQVVKATNNKQEPFVYGSLGGANIALVPAADLQHGPTADFDGQRTDYIRVEKIGTKRAWEIFLAQYPSGFYADLARENLAVLNRGDEAQRLQAEKDRLAKEQAEKERLAREQAEQARLAQERAEQEQLAQQRAELERLVKEQAAREQAAREQAAKEQAAKEQAAKEQAAKEQAAKEQAAKEQAARDQAAKDQATKELAAKEQAAKEQAAKDQAATAVQQVSTSQVGNGQGVAAAGHDDGDKTPSKIALLTPPAEPAPAPEALSSAALIKSIKSELARLGCYSGNVDEQWSDAKAALGKFAKYAKLSTPTDPAPELLDLLHGKSGRVCPLECGPREVEKNGQCIAKTCPAGNTLNDDGNCSKVPKKITALPDAKDAPAAAGATGEPSAAYDPYDMKRIITPGGKTTCGPKGCEKVPVGCYAVRNTPGGGGLGGKIVCGQPMPDPQAVQNMTNQHVGRGRGGYNADGSRRGYGPP